MTYRANEIWNRDVIKYIAMVTMLLDHIALIFLPSGTVLAELFIDVGSFTAITMCYFMVEGYEYTRSKRKYAIRLLLFAAISQLPFCMAFASEGFAEISNLNIFFTLFLCFLIIHVCHMNLNPILRGLFIVLLTMVSLISDWALMAPIFTCLFVKARGNRQKLVGSYIFAAVLYGLYNLIDATTYEGSIQDGLIALGSVIGIVASGVLIVCLYNGKRMEQGRTFSKWFFYIFYPAHLVVLGLIRFL